MDINYMDVHNEIMYSNGAYNLIVILDEYK